MADFLVDTGAYGMDGYAYGHGYRDGHRSGVTVLPSGSTQQQQQSLQPPTMAPGGDEDWIEVTDVFAAAAKEMKTDQMIFMEKFGIQDAMSAIEIGEPRLDTGIILSREEEAAQSPFDPLMPLFPHELCWILDQAFAYEMQWHQGHALSNTVYALNYIHYLDAFDPDCLHPAIPAAVHMEYAADCNTAGNSNGNEGRGDPKRTPVELTTVVMRAATMGLLKCCDLAWKALSKGVVQDGEDWQSEKSEISLLENVSVAFVVRKLDDAVKWLNTAPHLDAYWKQAILHRIQFRKILLHLFSTQAFQYPSFQTLLAFARSHLNSIRAAPDPPPFSSSSSSSPSLSTSSTALPSPSLAPSPLAQSALDPYIARKLHSFCPFRKVDLPATQDATWAAWATLFDGMDWMLRLVAVRDVVGWVTAANLHAWLPGRPLHVAYIRASIQSAFLDRSLVLNEHPPPWLVDRFFVETLGMRYQDVIRLVRGLWPREHHQYHRAAEGGGLRLGGKDEAQLALDRVEKGLMEILTSHVKSGWYNPPRRRRHLMNEVVQWHLLYEDVFEMMGELDVSSITSPHTVRLIHELPHTVLHFRFAAMREIVLSGFQLGLYTSTGAHYEKCFAYWYAATVIEIHLVLLDDMKDVAREDSTAKLELDFQHQWLTALGCMCEAMFAVTFPDPFPWHLLSQTFARRYKWAFDKAYDDPARLMIPPVAHPDLDSFRESCDLLLEIADGDEDGFCEEGDDDYDDDDGWEDEEEEEEEEEEEQEEGGRRGRRRGSQREQWVNTPRGMMEMARMILEDLKKSGMEAEANGDTSSRLPEMTGDVLRNGGWGGAWGRNNNNTAWGGGGSRGFGGIPGLATNGRDANSAGDADAGGWAGRSGKERMEFMDLLIGVCNDLIPIMPEGRARRTDQAIPPSSPPPPLPLPLPAHTSSFSFPLPPSTPTLLIPLPPPQAPPTPTPTPAPAPRTSATSNPAPITRPPTTTSAGASSVTLLGIDMDELVWDPEGYHPWFPKVKAKPVASLPASSSLPSSSLPVSSSSPAGADAGDVEMTPRPGTRVIEG